jgi:diguanylate cyclase (GGDEF)-like protein
VKADRKETKTNNFPDEVRPQISRSPVGFFKSDASSGGNHFADPERTPFVTDCKSPSTAPLSRPTMDEGTPPSGASLAKIQDAVRVLHLEDNRDDQEIIKRSLSRGGIVCDITTVESQTEFLKSVQNQSWDLILSDYSLPTFDGYRALAIAKRTSPDTPFIFVTGTLGEDIAVETLKNGATDYVLKQKLVRLTTAVQRALNEASEKKRLLEAETALMKSSEKLRFLADHDPLTKLHNRAYLHDQLPSMLASAARHEEKLALLFVDLDRFKFINDSLGHSLGDLVLKEAAERMKQCVREPDIVLRLGGDEFLIALTGLIEGTDAAMAAERIRSTMAEEILIHEHSLTTTCSIGISVYPDDGADCESLIKWADLALYDAKDNGRNTWRFFTPDMNGKAAERLKLESGLRQAIAKDQLFVEYQPQVDLKTGKIVSAEALLRWRHPEMGLVSPATFIPIAENSGEILRIGEWVLRTACAQARTWKDDGVVSMPISVNVSAVQFRHKSFVETVKNVLKETGLVPHLLELELTESLLLSNSSVMGAVMKELTDTGVSLAIDDFGVGYCGLSYLKDYNFSKLKIDGSFVKSICSNSVDSSIAAAIIGMAKILGMKVLAECAETEEQIRFLREHNCDEVQGYYFSRPLSAGGFSKMARSQCVCAPAAESMMPGARRLDGDNRDYSA